MSDGQASVSDLLNTATQAERIGVPIDWKEMSFTLANSAIQYIKALETELEDCKSALAQMRDHHPVVQDEIEI